MNRRFKSTSMSFDAFERAEISGKRPVLSSGSNRKKTPKHKVAKIMKDAMGKK